MCVENLWWNTPKKNNKTANCVGWGMTLGQLKRHYLQSSSHVSFHISLAASYLPLSPSGYSVVAHMFHDQCMFPAAMLQCNKMQ